MTFRPATPEDVPAVLSLVSRTCAYHEKLDPAKYGFLPDPSARYDAWLRKRAVDPRSAFFVAQRDPLIVGFIVGTTEPEIGVYRLKEYGFLHDLWVEEAYRNEGIARQLVMLAVERFRSIGLSQVRLDVAEGNEPARQLFNACGFRPSVVEMLIEL